MESENINQNNSTETPKVNTLLLYLTPEQERKENMEKASSDTYNFNTAIQKLLIPLVAGLAFGVGFYIITSGYAHYLFILIFTLIFLYFMIAANADKICDMLLTLIEKNNTYDEDDDEEMSDEDCDDDDDFIDDKDYTQDEETDEASDSNDSEISNSELVN